MATPILATKLFIPPPSPHLVQRPRLMERLNQGLHGKLTLVSAPAGFGKTTLVSAWGALCQRPMAWFSLDEGDGDPLQFLTYFVTALQRLEQRERSGSSSGIGQNILGALQSPRPPAVESLLTALVNELATASQHVIVVLDDYHVLDAPAIDQMLTFLLDHLPPQLHLVITTREDPNLPLARLRARGQLMEVRAADLRFDPVEIADFLKRIIGLSLAPEAIAALEARTEGWIAGLQLAAISLQGRHAHGDTNVERFIDAFTGSHRFILDYLMEEVLQQSPSHVRTFLLQTAILDRLCAPLCDAVTGQDDGAAMLALLERSNLFLIPLDEQRQWYRYHHLFADVLRARANEEQPEQVPTWHQRASRWLEAEGDHAAAIHHALAARDFARAATLMESIWPVLHREHLRSAHMLTWVTALPEELVRSRPMLSLGYGWEMLNSGDLEAADVRLQDAERLLDAAVAEGRERLVVADEAELEALPAELASARAYLALAAGNVPATVSHAQRALAALAEDDYIRRGPAAALLGLACWANEELEEAYTMLAEGLTCFQKAGNITFAIAGTYGLADIRIVQGQLHAAVAIYEQVLQMAQAGAKAGAASMVIGGEAVLQGATDLHMGLGLLYREQGKQEAAQMHLSRCVALGEQAALTNWPHRWRIAQARIKLGEGDWEGALDLLNEAERRYTRGPVPEVRPIAALKAQAWIGQGRLREAERWAREEGVTIDGAITYLREFEHMTLARLRIAQYKAQQTKEAQQTRESIQHALALLTRLRTAAEKGGRRGSVIELLLLQALAHVAQQDRAAALAALEQALLLAEPEEYVRTFLDEGPVMVALLRQALEQKIRPVYVRRLLARVDAEAAQAPDEPPSADQPPQANQSLVEPLSERELEVLELVAQGLSNREIAERLFIALNTVKGHNRVIFGKLQVQRRTEAVAVAQELGLV